MHLWPSTRLRDSFKQGYLKNLEWNLHRMEKSEKKQSSENSTGKKLLDKADEEGDSTGCAGSGLVFCRDLLMILSCCYCCGACVDLEEN